MEFDRRVYRRELRTALGYGTTWFRELERRGVIPPGCRDPGGKRVWWPASEAQDIVAKLNADGQRRAA